jgi:hypothetical protein
MLDFFQVVDLAEQFGVLQAIKGKLIRQPDPAADKLVVVLEEISKIYGAIEAELVKYLSLSFAAGEDPREERTVLLTLEGGQVSARINEARGHCHKIENIYLRFLDPWFGRVLSPAEQEMTRELFRRFGQSDWMMVDDLQKVGAWLANEATETLNLVDAGALDDANKRVRAARKELLPVRQALGKAMGDLRQLQAEFIQASGTV